MLRMRPHLVAVLLCSWLAAGLAPAAPSPNGAAAAAPPATAPPWAVTSPAAEALQAAWGTKLLHALVIADVGAGSPAEKAGLRVGDVLEAYDRVGIDDAAGFEDFTAGMKAAARKGPVAAKIRRFEAETGPPRTLTVELRLPDDPQARLGLAVHPGVFFLEMRAAGAAAKAGVKPWDCIDSVEGEDLGEHARLNDFETHVLRLKNKEGNVRVTVGRWRPAPAGETPKIALDGEREVVLPVPGS